jgi:hypothetical protein
MINDDDRTWDQLAALYINTGLRWYVRKKGYDITIVM